MKKLLFTSLSFSILITTTFGQQIKVSYADSIFNKPFTGHVLLYLSKDSKEPKEGEAGLDIFPCFDLYVKDVKPGAAVTFDDKAVSFPVPLSDIERGAYYVQVVFDRDLGGRGIGDSPVICTAYRNK